MATKAYVDAQGGGCYSKCADSGTSAGGATPSCPEGYSSVDTWSERAGYAMKQWQGVDSVGHYFKCLTQCMGCGNPWKGSTTESSFNSGNPNEWGCNKVETGGNAAQYYINSYMTATYTGGSADASYYNDCVACCAD